MGFSVMLWGAEKLVPAEYWCPYGTCTCHRLRAKRGLTLPKDVLLRTRRVLALYKVYGDKALLVLNATSLININALLALSWRYGSAWTWSWKTNITFMKKKSSIKSKVSADFFIKLKLLIVEHGHNKKKFISLLNSTYTMDLLQMDCLREPFFDHDDRHRHLAVRIFMTTSKWLDNDDYVIM